MKRKFFVWFCVLLFALGVANFASFFVVASYVGGDAHHVNNGHYFLWDKTAPEPDGRFTEVSRFTYLWVLWQGRSLLVTQLLALLSGWVVFNEGKKRREKER